MIHFLKSGPRVGFFGRGWMLETPPALKTGRRTKYLHNNRLCVLSRTPPNCQIMLGRGVYLCTTCTLRDTDAIIHSRNHSFTLLAHRFQPTADILLCTAAALIYHMVRKLQYYSGYLTQRRVMIPRANKNMCACVYNK